MKLKEWLPVWLVNYVEPSAKEKTVLYYTVLVNKHLIPDIGENEMEDLTPFLLQQYITRLTTSGNLRTGKGLAPNTVNSVITVLQCSLKQAYEVRVVSDYVADKIKRPKVKEKQVICFSQPEQKKIEQAVQKGTEY